MKTKLNIAEILKNKPKGTKLYTDTFGELSIENVYTGNEFGITLLCKDGDNLSFYNDGRYSTYGEPILVPSKAMRDWSKFAWKKGDVLVSNDGKERVIFVKFQDNRYMRFFGKFFSQRKEDGNIDYKSNLDASVNDYTLENIDAAQTYINTIEKCLGGKLNLETLEIEKQTVFKDGDIAFADFGNTQDVFIVSGKTNLSEGYYSFIALNLNSTKALNIGYKKSFFKENLSTIRLATEEEKQQLFNALAKEGKTWDAEKKQIVDLKPKFDELKPFDRVLVRNCKSENWRANLFGYIDKDGFYCCVWANWTYCIPYIGNESLLGTTKDVEG